MATDLKGLQLKFEDLGDLTKNVMRDAYKYFVNVTPIRSGNARRNTKLNEDSIEANYPYAEVLDKGRHMTNRGMRGSKQAPNGMTKPTKKFIEDLVKKNLRKVR